MSSEDNINGVLECVEHAYSNLSPAAQTLLLCLAQFSKFIDTANIPNYVKQLQNFEPFNDYPLDNFSDAIQEAINWGLVAPINEESRLLTIQAVFSDFLQTKLVTLDEETRTALRQGFKNYYCSLADYYESLMNAKDAQEQQWGIFFCRQEYENLYNALQICLENQESISIYFCLKRYFDLIGEHQNNLKLAEIVCQQLENYPLAFIKGEFGYQIAFAIARLGRCQLAAKQYEQARKSYEKTLEIYDALESQDNKQKQLWQAVSDHQLGIVAQELREFEQARDYYQQALDIFIKYDDRYSCASSYHQLGIIAQELREFEQARDYYQQALEIKIEYGDRYGCASTYHHFGMIAQELREFGQAQDYYQQALAIFIEYGDRYSCARPYYQLGRAAQELGEFEQARHSYQQALDIYLEYGDRYSCASSYFQLGRLAEALGELESAKANYLQDLQITVEFHDQHGLEISLGNLASFYQVTQDESLFLAVSEILGVSLEELKQHFDELLKGTR
ncbi:tetratricopeptide repeat protein [Nostoc spongiaeforme FACHB-130]|uniref:Tetratricopeptide repeat protein n=1 Tax=Nostoc spongiaeforme FACHB-130 TaxID=1357510 RepID=A0ABR8FNJ2_9NOSO|nr:tetratricopeptide repeat protein [Nostoc spongiaeforme]MBD2592972.1 tetratricopeptide repeat protein [Nostoc spongiaeforme FACHB-130]